MVRILFDLEILFYVKSVFNNPVMYSCDVLKLTQILIQKLFSVEINIGTVKLIPIDLIKFIFHGFRLEIPVLPMLMSYSMADLCRSIVQLGTHLPVFITWHHSVGLSL